MAGKTKDETRAGCFAWLIRAKKAVNERWARARNAVRRRLAKENKLDKPLTADDFENETGSPDLIISKIRVSSNNFRSHGSICSTKEVSSDIHCIAARSPSAEAQRLCESENLKGEPLTKIDCTPDGNPDTEQVKSFVQSIIDGAVQDVRTPDEIVIGIKGSAKDTADGVVLDGVSMTSSVVSAIAGDVVTQSLTNIITELEDETLPVINNSSSLSSGAISELAEAAVADSLTSILTNTDDMNHSARSRPRTVTEVLETLSIDPTIGQLCDDVGNFPACVP